MKNFIILLMIATLISCSKESLVKEKESLSCDELKQLLANDQDFSNFITLKINYFRELDNRLSNLDKETFNNLKAILDKYKSADIFIEKGTEEEIIFYMETLSLNNSSFISIEKVFNKLDNYNYSKSDFFENLANGIYLIRDTSKSLKSPTPGKDCEAFAFNIYVNQLNHNLGLGYNIETADRFASIASDWAYVGCVYGSSK